MYICIYLYVSVFLDVPELHFPFSQKTRFSKYLSFNFIFPDKNFRHDVTIQLILAHKFLRAFLEEIFQNCTFYIFIPRRLFVEM